MREQVVAANVDVVFLVQALPDYVNVRRVERYLATAWDSGALPELVLTKIDLVDDPAPFVAEVEQVAFGVPVHLVSNVTGEGLDELRAEIPPGRTAALLGSSGIGKSTIVNRLAGEELLGTQGLRRDGRGRGIRSHHRRSSPVRRCRLGRQGRPTGNEGSLQNRAKNRHTQDDRKRRRYRCQTHVRPLGRCKLSDGMEIPDELSSFKFARQKSKLAGTIRGSYFVIKGEY